MVRFQKRERCGRESRMCPLGEGMVRFPEFFKMLAASGFRGPLSVHLEYEVDAPTESARREKTLAVIEKDCRFVKKQLAAVYRVGA